MDIQVLLGPRDEADFKIHGGNQGDCHGRGGQVPGSQPKPLQVNILHYEC